MASFEWSGFGELIARVGRLANPDAGPLLEQWEDLIEEDNRTGVLAGLDKDGVAMRPVTYRPIRSAPKSSHATGPRGIFAGLGPSAAGLLANNNLSSSAYRRLAGPPLAPRGSNSRVITNLFTKNTWDASTGVGSAVGAWRQVVSTKGVPFLLGHFTGANRLPVRDLRGVRPDGRAKAVNLAREWALDLLKGLAA